MNSWRENPLIYEINTRAWLNGLGQKCGRRLDLASVPSGEWEALAAFGIDALWFMGVWERSPRGLQIALGQEKELAELRRTLPGFSTEDVVGSPYCVRRYVVDEYLGGPEGLSVARNELAERGIRLILDFVPNHTAQDHPWVSTHPEYYIQGDPDDPAAAPSAFFEANGRVIAKGRDPFFAPWQDVAQLNGFNPALRKAAIETIRDIAGQCDGIRCDMAMLLMNGIFARTWGKGAGKCPNEEYWVEIIEGVRRTSPEFLFIAEVYWDLEWELQQQGFDFCYDKRLYDRFLQGTAEEVRLHLLADPAYQKKLLRFMENHDEDRAAAVFSPLKERAVATALATLPGAKLFHDGQFEGRKIKVPVWLRHWPPEEAQIDLQNFYRELLAAVDSDCFHKGEWTLCDRQGWPDNPSWRNILAWCWGAGEERYLIVLNWSDYRSQALVRIPWPDIGGVSWKLIDVLNGEEYDRDGNQIQDQGLYVDLENWSCHFLKFFKQTAASSSKMSAVKIISPPPKIGR
jgi:hypothetical protein